MPGGEGSRCIANREPRKGECKGECDLAQSAACTNGLEDELPANALSGPLCRVGKGEFVLNQFTRFDGFNGL